MTYLFRGVLFQLLYFVPIMALKHINPYYSLLNHLFYFRLLYSLHVSISIKPIIYIISLISYYFNQTVISVIIAIIDIIVGTLCCNVLSHPFGPIGVYYISRDQPKAHEFTNHILHPSPEPSLLSLGAPSKRLHRRCGMVPVSQTGTTGSFPRILSMGMT